METGIEVTAKALGVAAGQVQAELASAIRRSEPDANEVYGVINGRRFVGRRVASGAPWTVSLEGRPKPWERVRR
jgi:hypothetical protein